MGEPDGIDDIDEEVMEVIESEDEDEAADEDVDEDAEVEDNHSPNQLLSINKSSYTHHFTRAITPMRDGVTLV